MANLPIEDIEKMVGSRYALTVLAGKRARDLRDGAPQLVNSDSSNPILVALQEILEGKVVAQNLDLSAGIEARLAIKTAEAAQAVRAAAALAGPAPTGRHAAAEIFPLPVAASPAELLPLTDDEPVSEAAEPPIPSFSAITDDVELEEEEIAEADEFTALDGNIDPGMVLDTLED